MKKIIFSLSILTTIGVYAQTGVNTTAPKATLDVIAKNTDGSTPEGVKTPQLTGDAVKAMTANLGVEQNGMLVYVTSAVTTTDASTANMTFPGYYRFNLDSSVTPAEKSWVRLESSGLERVLNSMTQSERAADSFRLIGETLGRTNNAPVQALNIDMALSRNLISSPVGTDGYGNIALGLAAYATSNGSTAIGAMAKATADTATALGNESQAGGSGSLALAGGKTTINGASSISLGKESSVDDKNSFAAMGGIVVKDNSFYNSGNNIAIGKAYDDSPAYVSGLGNISFMGAQVGPTIGSIGFGQSTQVGTMGTFAIMGAKTMSRTGIDEPSINIIALGGYATGSNSITVGAGSTTFGDNSIAIIGGYTKNASETSIGNGYSFGNDPVSYTDKEASLFTVGNSDNSIVSNALTILRNAKTGIGLVIDTSNPDNSKPTEMLDVNGNIRSRNLAGTGNRLVVADANGVLRDGGAIPTATGNIYNQNGTVTDNRMVTIPNGNNLTFFNSGSQAIVSFMGGTVNFTAGIQQNYRELTSATDFLRITDYTLFKSTFTENVIVSLGSPQNGRVACFVNASSAGTITVNGFASPFSDLTLSSGQSKCAHYIGNLGGWVYLN